MIGYIKTNFVGQLRKSQQEVATRFLREYGTKTYNEGELLFNESIVGNDVWVRGCILEPNGNFRIYLFAGPSESYCDNIVYLNFNKKGKVTVNVGKVNGSTRKFAALGRLIEYFNVNYFTQI